jgi:hypothetical protein
MPCIHRGNRVGGNYICHSDRLENPAGYVSPFICNRDVCPFYDLPNQKPAGAGDWAHRVVHALRIDTVLDAMGIDCGCAGRKQRLNELFPTAETPIQP